MAEYFKGTVVPSTLVNSSSGDTYGTHHSVLGVGGYMEVGTLVERNAIPVDTVNGIYYDGLSSGQRRLGMLVHVYEDNIIYHLQPNVTYNIWTGYTNGQKLAALADNNNWQIFLTSGGTTATGENISKSFYQVTHGFVIGDVIGFDGTNYVKVDSSTANNIEPLGIVSQIIGLNDFTLTYAGYINTIGIVDYSGNTLTGGTVYYLASTAGKLTSIQPSSLNEVSKPMLVALSSGNTGIVLQYRGFTKVQEGVSYGVFTGFTATTQVFLDKTVTGGTNIGFFSGKTGVQTLSILTSNTDYNSTNPLIGLYVSQYNNYYRDDNGIIRLGTPFYNGALRRGYVSAGSVKKSWVYNYYTGSSNQIGWILVDGDITTSVGTFLGANNVSANAGTPPFSAVTFSYTGGTMNDGYYSNSSVSLDVNGDLYTGSTYVIGGPVYSDKLFQELRFRTIMTNSPESIKITYNDNFVYISGATTGDITGATGANNVGSGVGIFKSMTGNTLQFYSLRGSGNTTVVRSGDTIIIRSSGGTGTGTITGATNGINVTGGGGLVSLGGDLTNNTIINGRGLYDLGLINIDEFQITTTGSSTTFGLDKTGFIFDFSGGTVTFDDSGGLKYGGDYSSNYDLRSLVDMAYVTGQTSLLQTQINNKLNSSIFDIYTGTTAPNTFLKLNQTIPQDVCYGQPIFNEGIILGSSPSPSQISGHTTGRIFYDTVNETISADIGLETTLQIGQETLRQVYNATGSIIPDGSVVYVNGIYTGGPGPNVVTVGLAIATGNTKSQVVGVTTQSIGINSYGFVTVRGNINNLNTLTSSQYSGMTVGDKLYLSDAIFGGITNVAPISPNIEVNLGELIIKDSTNGRIYVNIFPIYNLNNLTDVNAPSPSLDNVLKWNGVEWVNGTVGAVSAGAGVNLYYSTPIINNRTSPVGLDSTGTLGNGIQVMSLSKTPVTSGGTQYICAEANNDTRAAIAWLYNEPLKRNIIDSGTWEFTSWLCVDSAVGTTTITNNMYQVIPITGSTITTSGASANARRADISSNQFTGSYFTGSTINTSASWLQTPSGIYQICDKVDNNRVCIVVPTGYVNESGVTGNTWNKLFGTSSPDINDLTYTCYVVTLAEPAFAISCTDKLGRIGFLSTTSLHTVGVTYNGTTQASYIKTPLITMHNDLAGLQGGTATERYHITQSQAVVVSNTSGVNTGDETCTTIQAKLTGEIFTHYHPYSGLTGKPDLNNYQTLSGFTGYTATTTPIINSAITGVTTIGSGVSVYSGKTSHDIILNDIIGSGDTLVQKIGDNVVIYSVGCSGLYNLSSPSAICVGGICAGTVLTGKTAFQLFEELLVPELCGIITAPSTSIGLSASGLYEIGCNVSQTVTSTFNRGCINPQYCSISDKRSGCANAYCFTGTGMPSGWQICTSSSAIQTNPSYIISAGTQIWGTCTRYDAGFAALGSKGTEYCSALSSGNTIGSSSSIIGVYPLFATSILIDNLTKQPLQNMSTANNICISLVPETGGTKQKFEIPCAWLGAPTNRPLIGVCQWNTVSNQWEYPGGSAGCSLNLWSTTGSTETIQGNSIGYCQYTYNGVDRSSVCIRLVF